MRDDLPSITAIYVAFARALASHVPELSRACSDPFAERLLPRALLPALRLARSSRSASDALRIASLGLSDHLALRTGLIDLALETAVEDHGADGGTLQVVLLGAGLDARAHRMAALASARVFEVDHPATQALKRKKAKALPVAAGSLTYVPCDFHGDRLTSSLLEAGFDRGAPAVWIWEGVTMYLEERAVRASLQQMRALSAPGSSLIATYLTPELVTGGSKLGGLSVRGLGVIAEPIQFTRTPEQLAALLAEVGFEPRSDIAPVDAAPHFALEVKRPTSLMPKERVAVARVVPRAHAEGGT